MNNVKYRYTAIQKNVFEICSAFLLINIQLSLKPIHNRTEQS